MDTVIPIFLLGYAWQIVSSYWNVPSSSGKQKIAAAMKLQHVNPEVKYNYVGDIEETNVAKNKGQATIMEGAMGTINTFNNPLAKIGY